MSLINEGSDITIKRQCELLGVARSSYYYKPKSIDPVNFDLMQMIDNIYTRSPFYGSRKIAKLIKRLTGFVVNRKRIARLMRLMGIAAIYPKPRTSIPNKQHRKYPYLMKDMEITGPNQAWCTDITYIRLEQGFVYLVAIMDWYSRRVLSWKLSNTMDTSFCIEALKEALQHGKPQVFNSDQGSQFTSNDFTSELLGKEISISMDGTGRMYDNIFIERLWRTVKYENVFIKGYKTMAEARCGLKEYFEEYNTERPHQSLGYKTPNEVHYQMAA